MTAPAKTTLEDFWDDDERVDAKELMNSGLIMSSDYIIGDTRGTYGENLFVSPEDQWRWVANNYSMSDAFVASIVERGVVNPLCFMDSVKWCEMELGLSDDELPMNLSPYVLINGHHRLITAAERGMRVPVLFKRNNYFRGTEIDRTLPFSDDDFWDDEETF